MKVKLFFLLLGIAVKGLPMLFQSENGKFESVSKNKVYAQAKVAKESFIFQISRKNENLRENSQLKKKAPAEIVYNRKFVKSDHSSFSTRNDSTLKKFKSQEVNRTLYEEFGGINIKKNNKYRQKRFESGDNAESVVSETTTTSSRETFDIENGVLEEDFTSVPTDIYTTGNIFYYNSEFKNNLNSTIFQNLASASINADSVDATTHAMEVITTLGTSRQYDSSFNNVDFSNTLDLSQSTAGNKRNDTNNLNESSGETGEVFRLADEDAKGEKNPEDKHLKESRFVENKESTLNTSNLREKGAINDIENRTHDSKQVFNIIFPIPNRIDKMQEASKAQLLHTNHELVLNMSDFPISGKIDDHRFLFLFNQSTRQTIEMPEIVCLAQKNCSFKIREGEKHGNIVPGTRVTLRGPVAPLFLTSTLSPIEQIKQLNQTVNALIDLMSNQGLLRPSQSPSPPISSFKYQEEDDTSFKYTQFVRDGLKQVGSTIVDGLPLIPNAVASGLWQLSSRIGNYTPSQNIKARNPMPQEAKNPTYLSIGPVELAGNNDHQKVQSVKNLIKFLQDSAEEEELSNDSLIVSNKFLLNQSKDDFHNTEPIYIYKTYDDIDDVDYIDQDDETAITYERPTATRLTATKTNDVTSFLQSLTQEQKIIFGTVLIVISAIFIYGSSNSDGNIALPLLVLVPVAAFIIYRTQTASGKRSETTMSWILRLMESYPEKIDKYR
ncbi:hypothetical protein QYM36_014985 [Artemia franciscana]|uniref:Uncharacterized protein n=1 Tax=Artemia franciscana TaxID=6661 RepID=A0AA88HGS5_ARTSF|nr:hypothetical protein QYM36_014985 [Artemia franciscana]